MNKMPRALPLFFLVLSGALIAWSPELRALAAGVLSRLHGAFVVVFVNAASLVQGRF